MANPLTGNFSAVVQVSVPTINRLLASMHQNHSNDANLPTLQHRKVVEVGGEPLTGSLAGIKGSARVQIGAPSVSLIPNASRSANISCWIRARYSKDPNSTALPEFIHGKIVARFDIADVKFYGVLLGIRATASPDDSNITFADSGLNSPDSQKVSSVIRDFLRKRADAFLALPHDIPPEALAFRALTDSEGRQAIALPVTLSGSAPGSGSLGQVFLDDSDVAIALSKEAILELIQPGIKALNEAKPKFSVTATAGWGPFTYSITAHYTVSMTATAEWKNESLILHITGSAHTPHLVFPDASFDVSQGVTFDFDAASQSISLSPSGEPDVNVTVKQPYKSLVEGKAEKTVKAKFEAERDSALKQANKNINATLAAQRAQLRNLLRNVDDGADLTITSAYPTGDGVLVKGKIGLSQAKQPRVEFSPLGDGSGYTAFESWVPGGRITQFHWTWWRASDVPKETEGLIYLEPKKEDLFDRYVLQGKELPGIGSSTMPGGTLPMPSGTEGNVAISKDVFDSLLPKDPGGMWIPPDGQLCLSIFWERISPETGKLMTGGAQAAKLDPGIGCSLALWSPPRFTEPVKFKTWPCPEVNVVVTQPSRSGLVDEVLLLAIRQAGRSDATVMLVVALDMGSRGPGQVLLAQARDLQRRYPEIGVAFADRKEEWLNSVDLPADRSRPAVRLADPAGRLKRRHDGVPDATAFARALSEHLIAGPPRQGSLLQTRVRAGDRAPDFSLEISPGNRAALRKLRGRRLAIVFVPEGTATFENVLRRLPVDSSGESLMLIIVVDGEINKSGNVSRALQADRIVTADPQRVIARSYGITARPTAVFVDRDGRVSAVQMMPAAIALSQPPAHIAPS